ncbi:MAG: hypothetical protein O9341_07195 [Paucibacter sp.]|nr:hypothetical protein [Roseateles sp.]
MPRALWLALSLVLLPVLQLLPQSSQAADPLWLKTLAHLEAQKQVVPDESSTRIEATSNYTDTTLTRRKLDHWEGSKPIYRITAAEPPLAPGDAEREQQNQQISETLGRGQDWLTPDTPVRRNEGVALDGQSWTLFEAEDKSFTRKVQLRAWVDPETGRPHRIDIQGRFVMVIQLDVSSRYQTDARGRSLAQNVAGTLKVDTLGKGMNLRFDIGVDSWAERP